MTPRLPVRDYSRGRTTLKVALIAIPALVPAIPKLLRVYNYICMISSLHLPVKLFK